MKKLMIALSLAAVFSGSVFAENSSVVSDELLDDLIIPSRTVDYNKDLVTQGKLTFNGEILANTCSIEGNADKTIALKKVSNTDFSGGKTELQVGEFDILLENCAPNENKLVSISFSADQKDVNDYGYLINTAEGDFKSNVFVKLMYNGKSVDFKNRTEADIFDSADVSVRQDYAGNSVPFNFKVFYVKNANEQVTAGKVVATAQYQIAYK